MSLKVGVPWSSVFGKPILHFLIVNIVNGQHAFFTTGYWTEFRLDPISWLKYVAVSKGCGDWQLHFLPGKLLNHERIAIHTLHLTLDGLDALPFFFATPQEIREATFSICTRVNAKGLRCIGQTQAQHGSAGKDTECF
jgi:hypothetical protein